MWGGSLVSYAVKQAAKEAYDTINDEPYIALEEAWVEYFEPTDIDGQDLFHVLTSDELQEELDRFRESGRFDTSVLGERIEKLGESYGHTIVDGEEVAQEIITKAQENLPMETQQRVQTRAILEIRREIRTDEEEEGRSIPIKHDINMEKTETISSNIFSVTELPDTIFRADTYFRTKKAVYDELKQDLPSFVIRDGMIYSFSDLSNETNPLAEAIDGNIEEIDFQELADHKDKKYYLTSLMNAHLSDRFYSEGAINQKNPDKNHTYFIPIPEDEERVDAVWTAERRAERWMSRPYRDNYEHKAVNARFMFVESEIYLLIEPTLIYTVDGYHDVSQSLRNRLSSRNQSFERNIQYNDNVKFWSYFISRGKEEMDFNHFTVEGTPEQFEMNCSREQDYRGSDYYGNPSEVELIRGDSR